MSKCLLTQSLLGSWFYIYNAYEGYEDDAQADFISVLNRERRETTKAMQEGIDFENAVNACVDGADPLNDCVRIIADIVRGGQKQVPLYRDASISNVDFLLYGKLDYLKAGIIYDIKFSKSYEVGKYYNSAQHPFYFELCPEAREFIYLVSDGRDVFSERYMRSETPEINETISDFLCYLADCKLTDVYFKKWAALS